MTREATDQVTTIGIDIGKNNFHLMGLDGAGNIVLHRKLSRSLGDCAACQPAAVPDRHGGLRWRAPSEPTASGARP